MEGSTHAAVDTGRLLFVCTGAFVGLKEIIEHRIGLGRSQIGFLSRGEERNDDVPDLPIFQTLCQAGTEDLVRFGMIPEFVGRFATISVLHELSRSAMCKILGENIERSALALQKELARIHGIELVFTDEALDTIAAEAEALGTGARGLHRLIVSFR
jgi:ATP-dependent Clp protease ATP-binding subunit ClpX